MASVRSLLPRFLSPKPFLAPTPLYPWNQSPTHARIAFQISAPILDCSSSILFSLLIFFKCLIFLPSFQPSLPATFFFPFRRKYQTSYIPWLWSWPLSPSTECRGHPHARHQDQEGIGAQGEAVVVGDATDDDGTHVEPLLLLDRPTYDDLRSIPLLIIFLGIKSKIIQPRQK
jgi:hypothetical protein